MFVQLGDSLIIVEIQMYTLIKTYVLKYAFSCQLYNELFRSLLKNIPNSEKKKHKTIFLYQVMIFTKSCRIERFLPSFTGIYIIFKNNFTEVLEEADMQSCSDLDKVFLQNPVCCFLASELLD